MVMEKKIGPIHQTANHLNLQTVTQIWVAVTALSWFSFYFYTVDSVVDGYTGY